MASPLVVRLHDGLRLAGALLAAGDWPEHEQTVKAYKPHRVAETARRHLAPHRLHPAAAAAYAAGAPALYAGAAADAWPASVAEHLSSFAAASELETLWAITQPAFHQAENDLRAVLVGVGLAAFLEKLFGPLGPGLMVYPNLLYPGRQPLAFEAAGRLTICLPPPPAWGASPPWRYSERPDEVLAGLASTAAEALFQQRLPAAHAALLPHAGTFALAAAVLFLRQTEDPAASDQFLVMEKKARNLPQLPYGVAALEAAVEARPGGFGDYVVDVCAAMTDNSPPG